MKSRTIMTALATSVDDSILNSPTTDGSVKIKINSEEDKTDGKIALTQMKPVDITQRNMKLLFCFVGLQVSYIAWGIVQEQLMTNEYKMGHFKSASFCVFGNRFFALFIALAIVMYKQFSSPKGVKDAPYYYYAPSSISNSISSWAQYEALKYVSFPTQVLSKSCKLIPVMLVGIALNRKSYPLIEYVEALAITAGVAVFTFAEKATSVHSERADTMYGAALLATYLCCDSFTSQWQSKVYKQYNIDQYQMMLGVNIWSIVMTGFTLLHSGEGLTALAFIMSDADAFFHMVILSVTSATGQLFIFYTIKEFGPVIFTIMMTTRQILSLFLSCLMFSHSLGLLGWIGAFFVFAIVINRIRRKGTD